jgi:endoglucanase Acf2
MPGLGEPALTTLRKKTPLAQQITFPVVQGMGYATAVYNDLEPLVESGVFFRKYQKSPSDHEDGSLRLA